ncbi:MAG: flagellar basal body L-ring protein FlgH [Rickettsia sp.]|nr:flagellar basal body L-ring protein FlgH [Rickettsia sp.]
MLYYFFIFIFLFLVSCADSFDKIKRIDKAPDLSTIHLYLPEPDKSDNKWNKEYHVLYTNSLWYSNSSQFFKDNRPWSVGDLIKITISIDDNAELSNTTSTKRNSNNSLGMPNFWGAENLINSLSNGKIKPNSLMSTKADSKHSADGSISRSEDISTEIAATVVKVLSNGNLLIKGHQEVRVNHELRQIKVTGIIRAKDISSSNSINVNQIAEARISYGGKGVVSDVQQPTIGNKIINILSPF